MTYTALCCLLILGDNLARVNREAVMAGIKRLQLPNGSFDSTAEGGENDMRFVYCAACVCCILNDWSPMNVDKAAEFIKSSQVGAVAIVPLYLVNSPLSPPIPLRVMTMGLDKALTWSLMVPSSSSNPHISVLFYVPRRINLLWCSSSSTDGSTRNYLFTD